MRNRDDRWLTLVAFGWTSAWAIWQAYLLYRNLPDRMASTAVEKLDLSLLAISSDASLSLAGFVLGYLIVHFLFGWINLAAFTALLAQLTTSKQTRLITFLGQLTLVTVMLSLANAWLYSRSASGEIFSIAMLKPTGAWMLLGLLGIAALYFGIWIVISFRQSQRLRWALALCCLVVAGWYSWEEIGVSAIADDTSRPNVIVIGVDSLRPDHMQHFGAPFSVTPNLDRFVADSANFTDTLTSQPHTFPATVSILTGQWPTTNGARGNLFPSRDIKMTASIAHAFRKAGYTTVFGIDESRFANIDRQYGFDKVIGPKAGLADFAMTVTSDNVLVNLLTNTWLGSKIFPEIHGNRAIDHVYDPKSFSGMLENALKHLAPRPAFLYLHFCSGHWPYRTGSLYHDEPFDSLLTDGYADSNASYLRGLSDADAQVGRLLDTLKRNGMLDDAVVVAMSDHGEDFNMAKDAVTNGKGEAPTIMRYGHGGSAFRAPQSRVLLSFRRYGKTSLGARDIAWPASVVDIAPTLADLVGLPLTNRFDGISLAPIMERKGDISDPGRIRFVESSFYPLALNKRNIDNGEVLDEVSGMYEFTPTGRIQIRESFIDFQIRYRQRSAQRGRWVVGTREDDANTPLVIDRATHHWWPWDQAPADARSVELLGALCTHWQNDSALQSMCRSKLLR